MLGQTFSLNPLIIYSAFMGLSEEQREPMTELILSSSANTDGAYLGDMDGSSSLHRLPQFLPLFHCLPLGIAEYAEELGVDLSFFDVHVSRSWGTGLTGGASIAPHRHWNSHLSAVYYLEIPPDGGQIIFAFEDIQSEFMPGLFAQENVENGVLTRNDVRHRAKVPFQVRKDMLLIFPSKTAHEVVSNPSEDKRVSVAIDILLTLKDATGHEQFIPPVSQWSKLNIPSGSVDD